ncbi:RNA-directed DNA polymerase, eukaryota, reverse transcriptase zinc-binding domain protein [Tanacetum coccineum]
MIRRIDMAPPPRNGRHIWLRFDAQDYDDRYGVDMTKRLRMEHTDAQGKVVFTSYAWRMLLGIRGPLVREVILEFYSTFFIREGVLDLDAGDTFQLQLASKAQLRDYWTWISSSGDFLSIVPSYTLIREPLRRLCHKLIALSIVEKGQAPKKGARMSKGHFIACLGVHFGVITEESLQTLIVEVALGPQRQQAVVGAAHIDPKAFQYGEFTERINEFGGIHVFWNSMIILGWNSDIVKVVVIAFDDQVLHTCIYFKDDKNELFCSFVYAHNKYMQHRGLWQNLITRNAFVSDRPWCILGDFNVSLTADEKSTGTSYIDIGMRDFQDCVNNIEMSDVNSTGLRFT